MAVRYGSVGVATTRTVPPAPVVAGGGGAAAVEEWTDVPLGTSNYHITARGGSTELAKWNITNPTGTSMRFERTHQEISDWEPGGGLPMGNTRHQHAPCIIFKTQMDPRPLDAHALSGVTDNRWRHGECQLTVAMRLSEPFHTSGSGNGIGIGCGVGFLFSKTDIGSGAVLVAANPTPPFVGNQTTGGANEFHYFASGFTKANSASSDWFQRETRARGDDAAGIDWYDTYTQGGGLFGATNQLDTAVIELPHHPNMDDTNKGFVKFWFEDSRDNRSPLNGYYGTNGLRNDSQRGWQTVKLDTEGTYVYIALFPMVWWSDPAQVGSALDVLELKYNLSHIKVGA